MTTIEISDEVLAALQKLKRIPAESDAEALDRVIRETAADRDQKLREYEKLEPDTHSTN